MVWILLTVCDGLGFGAVSRLSCKVITDLLKSQCGTATRKIAKLHSSWKNKITGEKISYPRNALADAAKHQQINRFTAKKSLRLLTLSLTTAS